ncbi:D-serine ammonia-lyase [Phytohabitans suffuscus]|uniref:D-serine ammonia-lyase n=1 Tax=Phytohabitans suffuscus TaxID=624315 RepID=UPI0022B2A097|nr:D-serine ammonia-lyase [Phytohabitans suffuscus]
MRDRWGSQGRGYRRAPTAATTAVEGCGRRRATRRKKLRLVNAGAAVIEHTGDYLNAVAHGREESRHDARSHFVDDEYSADLFNGYAVAAAELKAQFDERGIVVDRDHPLFVYLPCGVGGAPGGITFSLKDLFGADVHCFFAEPVAAPSMLVQLASGLTESIPISDLGLDGRTEADGLAVGRASMLVAPLMRSRVTGIHTVTDEQLLVLLRHAFDTAELEIEPSAAAGMAGPLILTRSPTGRRYLTEQGLAEKLATSCHVVWTTGGGLVPPAERQKHLARARALRADFTFDDA